MKTETTKDKAAPAEMAEVITADRAHELCPNGLPLPGQRVSISETHAIGCTPGGGYVLFGGTLRQVAPTPARHTPGPWIFYADLPSTDPDWHIVTTANKMRVLANVHIEPGNAMDLANARLIAAAPELLTACIEAFECFEGHAACEAFTPAQRESYAGRAERLRALIAKAKGGTL